MAQNLEALAIASPLCSPAKAILADGFTSRVRPLSLREPGIQPGLTGCSALATILSQLAVAIFLIDQAGFILLANAAAESLVLADDGLRTTNRRLRVSDLSADRALRQAINRALLRDHEGPYATEAVVPRPGRHPLLLSIVPLGIEDSEVSPEQTSAAAMAVVMDPEARGWSRLDGVAQAYGLTAAESRLLMVIVEGNGVDVAAQRLGITRATAKTHLQHIFAKTFTSRQSELVRLVANTIPPLRRSSPSWRSKVRSGDTASSAA